MRTVIFMMLCLLSLHLFGQEDYPDYRSKREVFTKIEDKAIRSDIASFSMGGIEESIGKDPLATIPISSYGNDSISFEENYLKVTIKTISFNPAKHKLNYYDQEKKEYLVKIDNKPYFGDYGKVPYTNVERVTIVMGRDTIIIPPSACSDLCNPILTFTEGGKVKSQNKVLLSADGHRVYVYMLKQEAGGSYEATWVIQDRKYVRRVVDFGFLK